jgi:hypothetical protein
MSTTVFDAPSPRGSNNAKLFLNSRGQLLDRHGRHWGASSIRKMAQDAALGAPPDEDRRRWGPGDWAAANSRHALHDALKEAILAHGLDDQQHEELRGLIDGHLRGESGNAGAAATDKNRGAAALDDEDFAEKVRAFLKGRGLDDQSVEEAIEIALRNREAGVDELPNNAIGGGPPVKNRVASEADLAKEYPGIEHTTLDVYGTLDPARNLPGNGTSRRVQAGDAALEASDAELAREYPGFENVTAGY